MADGLVERRAHTEERLAKLRQELLDAEQRVAPNACVYLTGSFGRGEAGTQSDLDLFIAGRGSSERRLLSRLDEICLKADLIAAARKLGFPEFSGDGEYLEHYPLDDLVKTLGQPEDDASNTLTARLLMLLESQLLIGAAVYKQAIGDVVAAYWRDYQDHKETFVPAFLANDILRLWRTFCVNYEARTQSEPAEKKAKRKLKNYKLKHSRLLTCYSAIAYLLAVFSRRSTVSPEDAIAMVKLSPTERLGALHLDFGYESAKVDRLLESYNNFLRNTAVPEDELLSQFMDHDKSRRYFEEANEFGDLMSGLLDVVGKGTRLHRLVRV